jgi:gamma-glutamyl hercynylcysteine S-oxide synthase
LKSALTLSHQEAIALALTDCRNHTLQSIQAIDPALLSQQSHPDFSPIGWHLGHIAFTESFWILEQLAGLSPIYPEYHQLFAADGLPKNQRQNLPSIEAILDYLDAVRNQTLDYLTVADLEAEQRLWWWLIQHESQHGETIAVVKELHQLNNRAKINNAEITKNTVTAIEPKMIAIPSGEFIIGSNGMQAQDNERPAHFVYLDAYNIDIYPVTCGQYQQFIIAEGYHNPQYWSREGWHWLQQQNSISQPLYWLNSPQYQNHPVYGVSYYEAEAYANFVGKRLPTEAEWEKAAQLRNLELRSLELNEQETISEEINYAVGNHNNGNYNNIVGCVTPVNAYPETQTIWGCYDMLGNVWEWTNSWFSPYEGFSGYPYQGYSEVYFDNRHKVLRGGSYVTRPYALRNSFRNWYYPWVREIFAGFRCAS